MPSGAPSAPAAPPRRPRGASAASPTAASGAGPSAAAVLGLLAVCAFAIGCAEFSVMGLLPDIAADMRVSIPRAGLLVSSYAIGVVIGAPLLTALGSLVARRRLLVGLMVIFTLGNFGSAMAPSFGILVGGRLITALPHGAFLGVATVAAAALVPREQRGRAIATIFGGIAASNVIGVPAITLLGQWAGWRAPFVMVAVVGALCCVALRIVLPTRIAGEDAGGLREQFVAFNNRRVWLGLLTTTLGFSGVFAVIGYVAPVMTDGAGFRSGALTPLLILLGAGMVSGSATVGRATRNRRVHGRPLRTVTVLLGVLVVVLLLFGFGVELGRVSGAAALYLLGFAAFTLGTPLQSLVMDEAGSAPALASAFNQAAFNLGNAIGPAVSGAAITAGLGYAWLGLVGAGLSSLGILAALGLARVRG